MQAWVWESMAPDRKVSPSSRTFNGVNSLGTNFSCRILRPPNLTVIRISVVNHLKRSIKFNVSFLMWTWRSLRYYRNSISRWNERWDTRRKNLIQFRRLPNHWATPLRYLCLRLWKNLTKKILLFKVMTRILQSEIHSRCWAVRWWRSRLKKWKRIANTRVKALWKIELNFANWLSKGKNRRAWRITSKKSRKNRSSTSQSMLPAPCPRPI